MLPVAPIDTRVTAAQQKAAVLREALPWITRFHGATVVIKYGGHAMVDEQLKRSFAADVALLHFVGLRPVVVHGGGPQINAIAAKLGLEARFVGGLRVTDDATMDVVRMVLLGQVNPELVGLVQAAGAPAVGVAGTDADLLQVLPASGPGGEDLGRVGQVEAVDPTVLLRLLDDGFVPVVATVGRDRNGLDRNINADLAAGAIAAALRAAKLVYLTDVPGLYRDLGDEGSLLPEISAARLKEMLASDQLHAGMRPKVASIVDALRRGVPQAHILDGRVLHAILLEVFTDEGVGTMVTAAPSKTPTATGSVNPPTRDSSGALSTPQPSRAPPAPADITARFGAFLLPTYRSPPLAFVRGRGTALFDPQGRTYLDFLCGLGVTNLGHAHPAVTEAVSRQAATLTHTSNLFATEPAAALAERLAGLLGWKDGRTFLANSGAEANEAAIKLARRHGLQQHPAKFRVVALEGSFHGRTLATLEATGQPAKHAAFAPLAGYVDHVPYDNPEALTAAVGPDTCAVLVEIVQGEGGVRPVPDDVLLAARHACDAYGALLIADEVQTGIGRTGSWFAFQASPIVPDVVTLAKALANGLPIGACVAHGGAVTALGPGDHASTFGGNPVACAAALAVLDTIEREGLTDAARRAGDRLAAALAGLVAAAPHACGVRGRGLLLALELDAPLASAVEAACRERLLICNAVSPDAVRLAPPLTVSDQEIDLAVAVLADALHTLGATVGHGEAEPQ